MGRLIFLRQWNDCSSSQHQLHIGRGLQYYQCRQPLVHSIRKRRRGLLDKPGLGHSKQWRTPPFSTLPKRIRKLALATRLGCTQSTTVGLLQAFGYRKVLSRWILHPLTMQFTLVSICQTLLLRPPRKGFMEDLVIGDES